MNLFSNIGITELVVILLLALLVVGPERLPELSRKVGKMIRDLRQVYTSLSRDLGPELSTLIEPVKQVRDSAEALRSLPGEAIRTFAQAASLDDEAKPPAAAVPASLPAMASEPAREGSRAPREGTDV